MPNKRNKGESKREYKARTTGGKLDYKTGKISYSPKPVMRAKPVAVKKTVTAVPKPQIKPTGTNVSAPGITRDSMVKVTTTPRTTAQMGVAMRKDAIRGAKATGRFAKNVATAPYRGARSLGKGIGQLNRGFWLGKE